MTPYEHAILSVRDFGGEPDDYLNVHEFLDSTKAHFCDWKHRMILHNTFGMILVENIFGPIIVNSQDVIVSTREIARRHIKQDLGRVPSISDWLKNVKFESPKDFNPLPDPKDIKYIQANAASIAKSTRPEETFRSIKESLPKTWL